MTYYPDDSATTFDLTPHLLARSQQGEVVETTDQFTPHACWRAMVRRNWSEVLVPSTFSKPGETAAIADGAWLSKSLGRLADIRAMATLGDDGLEATEYLVARFATWPSPRRPDLDLDDYGMPHFAAKADGFYLHLSVEPDASLNWFAKVGDSEIARDEDRLHNTALPVELGALALT